MRTKAILILCALLLCLFMIGCNASDASDTSTTTDEATTTGATLSELDSIHNKSAGWSTTIDCAQCHGDGRTATAY